MTLAARLYDGLHKVLAVIVACCILSITVLVCVDVFLRNLSLPTIPWQIEVSEYLQFIATFLGAPWVLRLGGHVRVDVLLNSLKPAQQFVLEVVADVLGLIASCFVFGYGLRTVYLTWRDNQVQIKTLFVPEWWLYSFVVVSGLLLIVEFIRRLRNARAIRRESVTAQL